jgi:hypothetical protein
MAGRIRSIEKSNDDLIGIRTRVLPACSIVPQTNTIPRALMNKNRFIKLEFPYKQNGYRDGYEVGTKVNTIHRKKKKNIRTGKKLMFL